MWNRNEIKKSAKEVLKKNYWESVIVYMIPILFGAAMQLMTCARASLQLPLILAGLLLSITIGLPLRAGRAVYALHNREEKTQPADLISAFREGYGHKLGVMFLFQTLILLWSLLLVIPGIICAYHYMLVPYLLASDPQISAKDAMKKSREMMDGQKRKVFLLDLSLLGWFLLEVVTLGVAGIFWVQPYRNQIRAELFEILMKNAGSEADADEEGLILYEEDGDIAGEDAEQQEESAAGNDAEQQEELADEQPEKEEEAKNERYLDDTVSLPVKLIDFETPGDDQLDDGEEDETFLDDTVSIPVKLIDFETPMDERFEENTEDESFLDDTVSIPVRLIDFEVSQEEEDEI